MKRLFDLIFCIFLLVLFAVPILLIIILIHTTSKGETLYWSDRVGKNNIIYKMPKFRTMEINTPEVATHLLKNPEKFLSPIGTFLRKTSLDELPQLWNVFIGDMSLVGPRPHMISDHSEYARAINNYGIRHWVKPGITGLAQARGLSGSKDIDLMNQRIQADIYYIENWSFLLDLKIILSTLLGQKKWV